MHASIGARRAGMAEALAEGEIILVCCGLGDSLQWSQRWGWFNFSDAMLAANICCLACFTSAMAPLSPDLQFPIISFG